MVMHRHVQATHCVLRELCFFFESIESTDMGMRYLEKRYLSILFPQSTDTDMERKVHLLPTTKY